jgi:hypothetical protein
MSAVSFPEGNQEWIYVFVLGQNSRLYVRYRIGNEWLWADQGTPPGGTLYGAPAAVTYRKQNQQRLHVFSAGVNRLWERYWNGLSWQWRDHGKPSWPVTPGIPELDASNNLAVTSFPWGEDQRAIFLFLDHNWSQIASRSTWDGSNWTWAAHGTPTGSPATGLPLGAAYFNGNGLSQPFCFVRYGNPIGLSHRQADFLKWTWTVHGIP